MTTSAYQKAYQYVTALIERLRSENDRFLPNVYSLARQAGTSHVTIIKVLDCLREKGVLTSGRGRRVRIIDPARPENTAGVSPERCLKWERLYRRINSGIVNGVYLPGAPLPSPKELMKTYGACYRTMRKALDRLLRDGRIITRPRGYAAAPVAALKRHDTVVLSGPMDASGEIAFYTPRSPEFLRMVEQECSRIGVRLEICPYDQEGDRFGGPGRYRRTFLDRNTSVIGFIVWTTGIAPDPLRRFMHRLAAAGRPAALLEESAVYELPPLPSRRRFRLFSMGISSLAGRRMGRYLLDLGHRRIAYIAPTHNNLWSRNRLAGLRSVFADAGLPGGVAAFTDERFAFPQQYPPQQSRVDAVIRMITQRQAEEEAMPVLLSRSGINELRTRIDQITWGNTMRGILIPFLEKAAADPSITAWVGAEDNTAASCLEYLRIIGKTAPRDVSVAGFDDAIEASLYKLTSYNFNTPAVVRAMLDFILNPRAPGGGDAVEIEGTVVSRRSSAAPP